MRFMQRIIFPTLMSETSKKARNKYGRNENGAYETYT